MSEVINTIKSESQEAVNEKITQGFAFMHGKRSGMIRWVTAEMETLSQVKWGVSFGTE